ncbi:efflux RND transporter periplasmic adaptor subunit [Undibacterium sp.]|jgi:multidrug efflux system membrane fusion protein|uniref:efflux RND transporter periplasmic adaptor subunit n=1 Tax=Undibacterium sp. TaxID=1914977 RepID=UPI002BE1A262|nr:efflux RND transporter periplasmic adaptor subunit [Undibacterium sp.]HTD05420.1 efflux RND transporter periplasmic adaptor subunit [Undibacterium sp.]
MPNSPITRSSLSIAVSAAIVLLIAAAGTVGAIRVHAGNPEPKAAPPATTVDVAEVVSRKIVDWQNYSGKLEAVDRVEIRPLVGGTLTAVHFKDGSLVKKGDLLFTIDPRPYAAEVARVQAQLAAAEARAAYTASDLARGERLLADNAIARRDYEEKQNAAREAAANVLAAQAALKAARLNLEYTQITAPVAGRISRAEVTVGNVIAVGAGSPPLSTLMSVSQVYASFDVDEQSFLKYVNPAQAKNAQVPVFLGLANEDGYSRQGKISSIDNRIDTSSGTIRVRAVFDNQDGLLLPGLYARIRLGGGTPHEALLIDEKAIGTDQSKRFVLTVDKENHTAYREVRLGAKQEDLLIVEGGLKAGERIVVNGLQRTRPGDTITPNMVPMSKLAVAPSAGPTTNKTVAANKS